MADHDLTIETGHVTIAVRDTAGGGTPVLLLPGAGANLAWMAGLTDALRDRHRVISVDLPGHGHSSDVPNWDWEAILDLLDAVTVQLGAENPAVVGSSLGGMLAALWAGRHPECPGAVSLDGNPAPTRVDQLPDLAPDLADAELARLHAAFTAMTEAMRNPIPSEQLDQLRQAQVAALSRHQGADQPAVRQAWTEAFDRNVTRVDGEIRVRPLPATLEQLRPAMDGLDLPAIYRAAQCPLLVVLATTDLPEQEPFADLYAAYRTWQATTFQAVAFDNPLVRTVALDGASHAMIAEDPIGIADMIHTFLLESSVQ